MLAKVNVAYLRSRMPRAASGARAWLRKNYPSMMPHVDEIMADPAAEVREFFGLDDDLRCSAAAAREAVELYMRANQPLDDAQAAIASLTRKYMP